MEYVARKSNLVVPEGFVELDDILYGIRSKKK